MPAEAAQEVNESERACLAENVYWEGRSEPIEGQQAIAHVTLNRVSDPAFPNNICQVVRQGGEKPRGRCQFSWWCDGKSDRVTDADAWALAVHIADYAIRGKSSDPTDGALYFHNGKVRPAWSHIKQQTAEIGQHTYYR